MEKAIFKSKFKYTIGQIFKDDKRDIIITDKKRDKDKNGHWWKVYKYKCNKCGFDCGEHYNVTKKEFISESYVKEGNMAKQGCACCCHNPQVVVVGINSIVDTAPWMIKYFQNPEDARLYGRNSTQKIYPICPECGRIKDKPISINLIYVKDNTFCSCSDKIPYPEKAMYGILEQLNLDFKTQLSKTTFEWCSKYLFDFYFNIDNEEYIIETHGGQHYIQTNRKGARSLNEEQKNDKIKKKLALYNGIKEDNYIVIDCRESELKFIKENVLTSRLNEIFDLDNIDWIEVKKYITTNVVKLACKIKKETPDLNTKEIGLKLKLSAPTIIKYLKIGNELGWCEYNSKEEYLKGTKKKNKTGKPIEMYDIKSNLLIGKYNSATELSNMSDELYKIHLNHGNIRDVCVGKLKSYKGYYFKDIEEM